VTPRSIREDRLGTTPVGTDDNRAIPGIGGGCPTWQAKARRPALQNTSYGMMALPTAFGIRCSWTISGDEIQSVATLGIHHLACGPQHVYKRLLPALGID